jgi:hypothetical protein
VVVGGGGGGGGAPRGGEEVKYTDSIGNIGKTLYTMYYTLCA